MKQLVIEYDPETGFSILHHPYERRFIHFVSQGIKPLSYRRFDEKTKKWLVHELRLPQVVAAGRRYFEHVDYSSVPDSIQIRIVRFMDRGVPADIQPIPVPKTPYATLHVAEDAPPEVIKAAYKALALKHHPDQGGDSEEFRRIDEAYKEITSKTS